MTAASTSRASGRPTRTTSPVAGAATQKSASQRVISALLFVVGIGLIVAAAGMWIKNQMQYAEQDRINEELATYADVSTNAATSPLVDWEGLKAVNSEVVGWLQIPGTAVNFPVYQASDNEKYLHTSAEGEYALGGQVFMDYENTAPGMVDAQTIVYGHHLRNGAMFKPISDMENQEMFDSVSTVWYVTEAATYELEPLLIYRTDANDTGVRQFNFASQEELTAYLQGLLGKAVASRADAAERIAGAPAAVAVHLQLRRRRRVGAHDLGVRPQGGGRPMRAPDREEASVTELHEECGVFGVWAPGRDVARITYFALRALQHRGQESAGIAVGDGRSVLVRKDLGLVTQVFSDATSPPCRAGSRAVTAATAPPARAAGSPRSLTSPRSTT